MRKFIFFSGFLFSVTALSYWLPPPVNSDYKKIKGDAVLNHHILRLEEAHPDASYPHAYHPVLDEAINQLPQPETLPLPPKRLSLKEAIGIALRNNPDVKTSELQRILDKFGLETSIRNSYGIQWQNLVFTAGLQQGAYPQWNGSVGFNVLAAGASTFGIKQSNNLFGYPGSTTLTFTQQLLKGFGSEIYRIPYENAIDTEKKARMAFKNSVMTVVQTVITNYRSLVEDYNNLEINRKNLQTQTIEVHNTQLQVKAGQSAPSDLLQMQANLESARLSLVRQQDSVTTTYQSFLQSIGLVPTTKLIIDKKIRAGNEKIPRLSECIELALQGNIAYQQALLDLNITKRALIVAKNNRKWGLQMGSSMTLGRDAPAANQPPANLDTNPTLNFTLTIPIDDVNGKQAVVAAQIAIENAELQLEQQKENLMRTVMTQWQNIRNLRQQIHISREGLRLQEITLQNTKLKLKYGRAPVFEVNQLENQLLSARTDLISTEIDYLNGITQLYQTLGLTLDQWNIKLRY